MVRTQTESSTAPGIPSGGSRQSPTMEGTTAEARPSANSLQHAAQPPPQPRKKRPEDFKFGKILGEGSFSTVSICSAIEPAAVLGAEDSDPSCVRPAGGPRPPGCPAVKALRSVRKQRSLILEMKPYKAFLSILWFFKKM